MVTNSENETEELQTIFFYKYQATGNDFLIHGQGSLDDKENLDPTQIRSVTDRHFGFGADGVIRALQLSPQDRPQLEKQLGQIPQADEAYSQSLWFMDYKNADGSIAEMCGNGIRAFLTYLLDRGLVSEMEPGAWIKIATRGGIRILQLVDIKGYGEQIRVEMGKYELDEGENSGPQGQIVRPGGPFGRDLVLRGRYIKMPNPHVVCPVDLDFLRQAPLPQTPPETLPEQWELVPERPEGINLELTHIVPQTQTIYMRVAERGAGETLSCGTGCCAAAVNAHLAHPEIDTWDVQVPGGILKIQVNDNGIVHMTGPAKFVGLVVPAEL